MATNTSMQPDKVADAPQGAKDAACTCGREPMTTTTTTTPAPTPQPKDSQNTDGAVSQSKPKLAPVPPEATKLYDTFEELFTELQEFCRQNGSALVKRSSSNTREINGQKVKTYYTLACDRDRARPSQSASIRSSSTRKLNCPFLIRASSTKRNDWKWSYTVKNKHNHEPSSNPADHPAHRRRSEHQKEVARRLAGLTNLRAREFAEIIRASETTQTSHFTAKDLYNDRQALRRQNVLAGKAQAATAEKTGAKTSAKEMSKTPA